MVKKYLLVREKIRLRYIRERILQRLVILVILQMANNVFYLFSLLLHVLMLLWSPRDSRATSWQGRRSRIPATAGSRAAGSAYCARVLFPKAGVSNRRRRRRIQEPTTFQKTFSSESGEKGDA